MNILGIIPARGGKQKLTNKNILPLKGKPVVAYSILAAQKSLRIDRLIVSTEDPCIAKIARKFNVEIIDRPKELALETSPIDECLRHVVESLEIREGYYADIVVEMYANVPVRKEGMIDRVIDKLIESDANSAVSVYPVIQYPQWVKTVDEEDYLHPFLPLSNNCRRQNLEKTFLIDGAVIAIETGILLSTKGKNEIYSYMGEKIIGIIQEPWYAVEIDSEEDLIIAESLLNNEKIKAIR
ncbi:N-acylneuraminate cytidylyltransferase [subsurface metagenome]